MSLKLVTLQRRLPEGWRLLKVSTRSGFRHAYVLYGPVEFADVPTWFSLTQCMEDLGL